MTARYETVIVGGGHAGLALSYHLGRLGRPHVILERGRVAERWRSERWDSLMFQFPNWSIRLPGQEYCGDDPDGFASREEVIAFIERYREAVDAPVRAGVRVDRVAPIDGGFRLETTEGPVEAAHVVIGVGGGHDIDLRDYAAAGVTLLGHLRDVTGSRLHLADDVAALLAAGDESIGVFTRAVDAYIARSGLTVPAEAPPPPGSLQT